MKTNRRNAITIAAAFAGTGIIASMTPARAETTDLAAVEQAVEALRKLMLAPEKLPLEALFADQLSYGHSDGRVQNQGGIYRCADETDNSITLSDQTISIAGDVAIVRHRFDADAVSGGKPSQPHIRVLQVWQKQGDTWRLLVRQAH